VVNSYGTGPKPIIDGNGLQGNGAFFLYNQQHWEINNLEVTNDASTAGDRRGIYLAAANFGLLSHLYVRNCHIHNVKGLLGESFSAKRTGAIIVETISDTSKATRFDDVRVENNVVGPRVDNEGFATYNASGEGYPGTSEWNARVITHLAIRNNSFNDIGKNAMIIRLTDETGVVEHNVIWDTAFRTGHGNQIYCTVCRGTVFQFNEGYLNRETAGYDGSMYDSDLSSPQTVWQYSYSHDNNWGLFVMDTTSHDDNIIVRYNISQNDKGSIFTLTYANTSAYIYNNTIYTPSTLSPYLINDRASNTKTYYFYNNIFYNLSSGASYNFRSGATRTFSHNLFYGHHPSDEPVDPHKVTADPLLVGPGTGGDGLSTLDGYHLKTGSPALNAGIALSSNGGQDFFGTSVSPPPTRPTIGAAEK
jgi:hypothetical protein